MKDELPPIGSLLPEHEHRRDAVHVAIAPVKAAMFLRPGDHVGFASNQDYGNVGLCDTPVGIVDPFLTTDIQPGQRFWLFLYPGTITSLRHIWQHPAFSLKPPFPPPPSEEFPGPTIRREDPAFGPKKETKGE